MDSLERYIKSVRDTRASGVASDEMSFYPAVNSLLSSIGKQLPTPCSTVANPAAYLSKLPDNVLIESASHVVVLPVEVKPASAKCRVEIPRIARSTVRRLSLAYLATFDGPSISIAGNNWYCPPSTGSVYRQLQNVPVSTGGQ